MSYLDDVEHELRQKYFDEKEQEPGYRSYVDEVVKFVRGKLLESYKNGAQAARQSRFAGQRGGQPKPQQKSKASK